MAPGLGDPDDDSSQELLEFGGKGRWGNTAAAAVAAGLGLFGLARYRGYLEIYRSPVTAAEGIKTD